MNTASIKIPLGITRILIDTLIELAGAKQQAGSERPLAERLTIQLEVGRRSPVYRPLASDCTHSRSNMLPFRQRQCHRENSLRFAAARFGKNEVATLAAGQMSQS